MISKGMIDVGRGATSLGQTTDQGRLAHGDFLAAIIKKGGEHLAAVSNSHLLASGTGHQLERGIKEGGRHNVFVKAAWLAGGRTGRRDDVDDDVDRSRS